MKVRLFILTLLACVLVTAPVNAANLVVNGDFEDGFNGWTRWNPGGSGVGDHSSDYAFGTPYTNDLAVWANDGGIEQNIAITQPGVYIVSADFIKSVVWPLTGEAWAFVKVEMSFEGTFWEQQIELDETAPSSVWQNKLMEVIVTENELNQHADNMRLIVMRWANAGGGGNAYVDNVSVELNKHRATTPSPAHEAIVGIGLSELSWTIPEPNQTGDTVTCNVLICEGDPNFVAGNPNMTDLGLATGNSISLDSYTLNDANDYYWRVDCTDPTVGTTQGYVWMFTVGDPPPDPNAGDDQYVWLDGGTTTFTLSGSYTDEGEPPVTTSWELDEDLSEYNSATTTVTIDDPNALAPDVTVTGETGWLFFNLTATDPYSSGVDTVNVGVYDTCAEAATADPDDDWDATGDVDGNCEKDLADFALLAAGWLDCNANKIICPE